MRVNLLVNHVQTWWIFTIGSILGPFPCVSPAAAILLFAVMYLINNLHSFPWSQLLSNKDKWIRWQLIGSFCAEDDAQNNPFYVNAHRKQQLTRTADNHFPLSSQLSQRSLALLNLLGSVPLSASKTLWCVYTHTHTHMMSWWHTHCLIDAHVSPSTPQGCFPPRRLLPCQCASCCPRLAVLMPCFFDRRAETDSMICTPAQTCLATSVPVVWLGNVCLGMPTTVCFTLVRCTGEQRAAAGELLPVQHLTLEHLNVVFGVILYIYASDLNQQPIIF